MSWRARYRTELYPFEESKPDPSIARYGVSALVKRFVASVVADAVNDIGAPERPIAVREIAARTGLTIDTVRIALAYLVFDGFVIQVAAAIQRRPAWLGIDLARCPQARGSDPRANDAPNAGHPRGY